MATITARNSFGREAAPAFLLTPLGWVIDRLGNAIEIEAALLEPLLKLDQARMHLIALALAHLSSEVCPDLALVLLRGPYREILDLSLGHRHVPPDATQRFFIANREYRKHEGAPYAETWSALFFATGGNSYTKKNTLQYRNRIYLNRYA